MVQEDKTPSHHQQQAYNSFGVQRLLWCGNSPDLNAIEPCWYWMKRATTKKGAPKNRAEAIRAWEKQWDELPQSKIQAWIERIPLHIQEIIRLEGGNECVRLTRLVVVVWLWLFQGLDYCCSQGS